MNGTLQNIWPLIELKGESVKDNLPFHVFVDNETMKVELFQIPVGAIDIQSPHHFDELYHIISGRAKFTYGDKVSDIGPGDTIYVKAYAAHRFHNITEDLSVLVVFSKKEPKI